MARYANRRAHGQYRHWCSTRGVRPDNGISLGFSLVVGWISGMFTTESNYTDQSAFRGGSAQRLQTLSAVLLSQLDALCFLLRPPAEPLRMAVSANCPKKIS